MLKEHTGCKECGVPGVYQRRGTCILDFTLRRYVGIVCAERTDIWRGYITGSGVQCGALYHRRDTFVFSFTCARCVAVMYRTFWMRRGAYVRGQRGYKRGQGGWGASTCLCLHFSYQSLKRVSKVRRGLGMLRV